MRRRLQRIYWIGIVCTLIMAMIAVSLLVMFRIEDKSESLRSVLETASAWTLESGSDLQTHTNHIASVSPPLRVTFLMDSGLVLADSEEDALLMNNHSDRPEVQAALRDEIGQSLRISDTQSVFMLYAAKRIAPNLILRLGYPIEMITRVLVLYSVGMILLFIILNMFQRRALTRFTDSLARQMNDVRMTLEGDAEPPRAVFPELQPALDNLSYRARRLNSDLEEVRRTLTLRNDFVANASHDCAVRLLPLWALPKCWTRGLPIPLRNRRCASRPSAASVSGC